MDSEVVAMTDWAEMPAPSPDVVAEGLARWSEAERARQIEAALDAYVMGVRPAGGEPLGRHSALFRREASYAVRWALRMTYPAIMGRP